MSEDDQPEKEKYKGDAARFANVGSWGTPRLTRDKYNRHKFHEKAVLNSSKIFEDREGNPIQLSVEALRYALLKQCRRHPNRSCKVNSKQSLCDECKDEFKHYYDRLRLRGILPLLWNRWIREGDARDIKSNRVKNVGVKTCKWAGGSCSKPVKRWGKLGLCDEHSKRYVAQTNRDSMQRYYLRLIQRRIRTEDRRRRKRRQKQTVNVTAA